MSHILGLEHSFGGILGQIGGVLGSVASISPFVPSGFGQAGNFPTVTGGSPGFNEAVPVVTTGGVTMGDGCGTSGTEIREVVINKSTGAVICIRKKKTRKRRKRLATASDIKDLGALKTILGPKALIAYISVKGF